MTDFRSDKMDSRDGKGIAKRAWEGYSKAVNAALLPLIEPAVGRYSVNKASDLAGFWLVWHLHGGFEGLQQLGMSERTIYRQIRWFRLVYGEHPDTFVMAGVTLDREAYAAAAKSRKREA
jgi:hypothetical protein